MNDHAHPPSELTKNQSLVMGALTESDGPLSAYTILDRLRGKAPATDADTEAAPAEQAPATAN